MEMRDISVTGSNVQEPGGPCSLAFKGAKIILGNCKPLRAAVLGKHRKITKAS